MKTNAVRLLQQAGVSFEVREYEVDPADLSAPAVARKVGLPPGQVWKTLVARGERHGVCLAVVPGDRELDLKALARARGEKKVALVSLKEVEPLTGYVRGGVTALGTRRPYPVVVDAAITTHERVAVSAGVRGAQVVLAPADYLRVTCAALAQLTT